MKIVGLLKLNKKLDISAKAIFKLHTRLINNIKYKNWTQTLMSHIPTVKTRK